MFECLLISLFVVCLFCAGTNVAVIAVPVIVVFFLILVIIGVAVFFATHYRQHRRIKVCVDTV